MLYALRVHSVDTPRPVSEEVDNPPTPPQESQTPSTSTSSAAATSQLPPLQIPNSGSASSSNSKVKVIRGVVHLYRAASSSAILDSLLPATRDTLLFVPAVPDRLSPDDFLHFCGSYIDNAYDIQLIKNDAMESRYSVVVTFHDQCSADSFYLNINGWRFSSMEAEVCHVLFIKALEYTVSTETAGTPPPGFTELPTCPVCLERLDQDISGIVATTCDHSFRCSCVSKWVTSSCSVCHFCQEHCEQPICSVCWTSENLWICVICSFVGCGRYREGHAFRHWKETQHCFSLDLETQRIWDYVGDTYVHRLNQSRSDGKSVKLKTHCKTVDDNFESCECSDDSGISGALFSSKVEAILDEYNHLLTSQLENQRQYYESLLLEVKEKKEKYISQAVDKAVSLKMQELQLKLETVTKEKKNVADMNEKLMKSQSHLREKIKEIEERERATLKLKEEKIHDLEEQIRDFTIYIEAQKTIRSMGDADDIKEGTVLRVEAPASTDSRSKRSSRAARRRR